MVSKIPKKIQHDYCLICEPLRTSLLTEATAVSPTKINFAHERSKELPYTIVHGASIAARYYTILLRARVGLNTLMELQACKP